MRRIFTIALFLFVTPALAQYWTHYANARFGYELDIPPGFEGQGESDSGDGQIFYLPQSLQELTVWGGLLGVTAETFEGEAESRADAIMAAGWVISSASATPSWATLSGTRTNQALYQRMILLCDGESYAAFRITHPAKDLAAMSSVLEGLARSFAPADC